MANRTLTLKYKMTDTRGLHTFVKDKSRGCVYFTKNVFDGDKAPAEITLSADGLSEDSDPGAETAAKRAAEKAAKAAADAAAAGRGGIDPALAGATNGNGTTA